MASPLFLWTKIPADQNENEGPQPLRLDSLTPRGGDAQDAQFCKDSPKAANPKNVDGRREMEEGLERPLVQGTLRSLAN